MQRYLMCMVLAMPTVVVCLGRFAEPCIAIEIIYVDPNADGAGNGSSWTNAYNYLQDALTDANSLPKPIEIRVAQGVYKPDRSFDDPNGTGDREATFQLINGITIKGGYAGANGEDPNARDVELYKSVLSGDLGGNDVSYYPEYDNSYRVVDGSNTDRAAVLDGFTIIRGYLRTFDRVPSDFDPEWTARASGGMRNISGSPTIINCTFRQNRCAVFNVLGSNPLFTNCRFEQNCAHPYELNSAMINIECNPDITECIFSENDGYKGGAIWGYDCDLFITKCTFSQNQASEGGAIHFAGGYITLTDCIFSNNHAGVGGAVEVEDANVLVVADCIFKGNEATLYGGGLSTGAMEIKISSSIFRSNWARKWIGAAGFGGNGNVTITDCIFEANKANEHVAEFSSAESLTLVDCVFVGNQTGYRGIIYATNALEMINCTLADNSIGQGGCIVIDGYTSTVSTVSNSIIWDHNPFEILNPEHLVVEFSNIKDTWLGEGNISTDPCFVQQGFWDVNGTPEDPNDDFWTSGDYHLKSQAGRWDPHRESWMQDDVTSSCIDAGDPMAPIGLEPFPSGGVINMGAYGGTAEASKSWFDKPVCETIVAGDINGDCVVDFRDFMILARHWLEEGQ